MTRVCLKTLSNTFKINWMQAKNGLFRQYLVPKPHGRCGSWRLIQSLSVFFHLLRVLLLVTLPFLPVMGGSRIGSFQMSGMLQGQLSQCMFAGFFFLKAILFHKFIRAHTLFLHLAVSSGDCFMDSFGY